MNKITLAGNKVEEVDEYEYSGNIMSFQEKTKKELQGRKGKAWKEY